MTKLRKIKLWPSVMAIGIMGVGVLAGLLIQRYEIFPYHLFRKVANKAESYILPLSPPRIARSIATNFAKLNVQAIKIPANQSGGGMTTFRNSVLLLTGGGELYLIDSSKGTRLDIEVPENGRDEYVRASNKTYPNVPTNLEWYRYNDVLYYEEEQVGSLLISYTYWNDADQCYNNRVARLNIDPSISDAKAIVAQGNDWDIIYDSFPCLPLKDQNYSLEGNMAGGRMAYFGANQVLLTNGDYYWDGNYAPRALAQRMDADYGKIVLIDVEMRSASIISLGHRNPQGICISSEGSIWSVEHGPRGGDEVNQIVKGGDYGWPKATLGTHYDGTPWKFADQIGRHDDFVRPIYAWIPSIGASNCTWIDGFDPSWDGDMLVASLTGRTLFRLRIREDRVVFVEPVKFTQRIRYVHQHPDGRILLWTDDGYVLSITALENTDLSQFAYTVLENARIPEQTRPEVVRAFERCLECHETGNDNDAMVPSLGGIFEGRIASQENVNYTDPLKSLGGIWSRENLQGFLRDPAAFAPGTSMPQTNITDEQVIVGLIELLKELKEESDTSR